MHSAHTLYFKIEIHSVSRFNGKYINCSYQKRHSKSQCTFFSARDLQNTHSWTVCCARTHTTRYKNKEEAIIESLRKIVNTASKIAYGHAIKYFRRKKRRCGDIKACIARLGCNETWLIASCYSCFEYLVDKFYPRGVMDL